MARVQGLGSQVVRDTAEMFLQLEDSAQLLTSGVSVLRGSAAGRPWAGLDLGHTLGELEVVDSRPETKPSSTQIRRGEHNKTKIG